MPRTVAPNQSGNVVVTERVVDADGDTLTLDSVELQSIDGTEQTGADRTPSWLSSSTNQTTLSSGATELLVEVTIDASEVSNFTTYEFEVVVSDPTVTNRRTVAVAVRPGVSESPRVWASFVTFNGTLGLVGVTKGGSVIDTMELQSQNFYVGGVAGAENGDAIVAEQNRIFRLDPAFNEVWENTTVSGKAQDIIQAPDGFIYFIDESWALYRMSRNGTNKKQIASLPFDSRDLETNSMVVTENNLLFFQVQGADTFLIDLDDGTTIYRDFNVRFGAHARRDGDLFVYANDNEILKAINQNGDTLWTANPLNTQIANVAVNPTSELIGVVGSFDLGIIDYQGNEVASIETPQNAYRPKTVLWDEADNLYVAAEDDNDDDRIYVARYDEQLNEQWRVNPGFSGNFNGADQVVLGVSRMLG